MPTMVYVMAPEVYRSLTEKNINLQCRCGCKQTIKIGDTVVVKVGKTRKERRMFLEKHYIKMWER